MAAINKNAKDTTSPHYINLNDGLGTLLTTHLLTSENYHSGAHTIRRFLRIKKKHGFIKGTLFDSSDSTDPFLETWFKFMTWLLPGSKTPFLKNRFVYVDTIHELWNELQQHFA